MNSGIKVFAPASVANVACGFDVLGFALERPGDEIIGRINPNSKGLRIIKITGDNKKLSYNIMENTAGFSAYKLLEHLNETNLGIDLELNKKMPFGSGLGSSAASAVAGVMIVNELLKNPLSKRELLPFAVMGEQIADGAFHADNVAPSLLGGMTLIRDTASYDVHRVPVPKGLYVSVLYPHIKVLTKDARSILSDTVSMPQMIRQTGNIAGLMLGCFNGDYELIGRSLEDAVIEPQRAKLIPRFYEVKEAALKAGALGCSISGAGPSTFAISNNSLVAEEVGVAMKNVYNDLKINNDLFLSAINQEGAILL